MGGDYYDRPVISTHILKNTSTNATNKTNLTYANTVVGNTSKLN
jgi:hypothetical protein